MSAKARTIELSGLRILFRGFPLPTYEYHCPACQATYELRQGFSAETTHTCEECGKGIAKRVLHAPPVVFKGGGWYVTDSRSRNPAGAGESKSESVSESDSGSSADSSAATPAASSSSGSDASAAS
ncbi:MAG: hypothetical protein LC118_03955 [Dehalococcoidia bacterium]|nr:hypothetical protein [Dehalococcoidia bacterium]